ncbi:MAG: ribonuclease HII, partial [Aequorivita sp.]|nr:ribonuclease HII [Aequorivita sp.]
ATDLSTASSLLIFKMNGDFSEAISGFFNPKSKAEIKNISLDEFPLAALQFSYDRNFAHVTLSCKEVGAAAKSISGTVTEKFSLKLENGVLGNPQVIEGQSGSVNVVAQDMNNKLYFISENGKILWTKNLDSSILGKIEEVEIFGSKHIAFVTKNTFYILDRNGKDAKGFPIKFKDNITQPLSVFDYDSNLNYRFAIVQGKEMFLYDKNGKNVKGFGFNKTKSNIVKSPVHIRMSNKDYIVVAEESGKLNILSRVGKSRISVSKNFNFSEIPIVDEDNTFVVITKENTKERISQDGKISSQKLDVANNYWFSILGNTKVTLDDNKLRINGKLTELPLGLYTRPQLFNLNRNSYVTITETQEKKVYVFDKDGSLLNGFPIYGTSLASLGEGNEKNTKSIAVKGDADSIILYSSN